jgi:hypothetical protein
MVCRKISTRFTTAAARLYFDNPNLPKSVKQLEIKNLKVASGVVDISLVREARNVAVNVGHRCGKVEVVVIH